MLKVITDYIDFSKLKSSLYYCAKFHRIFWDRIPDSRPRCTNASSLALKKLFLFSPSKIELSGEFFAHVTSLKNTTKQVATKSLQTFGCILHAYVIRCPKCGLDNIQDFLIVLDMKPCMYLVEISNFSNKCQTY